MEITYYGAGCVLLASKEVKILIDPLSGEYGPNPKVAADVVLLTQPPKEELKTGDTFTIDRPGEYEVNGTTIDSIAARLHTELDEQVLNACIFNIHGKDFGVLVLGNIAPNLSDQQLERIDGADVLILPVGGHGLTLDKEAAAQILRQFEPSYVLPVHYDDGVSQYPMPQEPVDGFLHEVGASAAERHDKLKITSRAAAEEMQVVVLNPQQQTN